MSNTVGCLDAPSRARPRVRRPLSRDDGFTLVELIVVVLVVGVLIAIAFPTFLGARQRAADTAAKSTIRTGLTAGRVVYTTEQDYTAATVVALEATDGSIDWRDDTTPSDGPTAVSTFPVDDGTLILAVYSTSGTCFALRDEAPDRTTYAVDTSSPGDCTASNAATLSFDSSW
jgi:type IV pilus assembly protein PilA